MKLSINAKFYCEFLLGLACTRIFIDEVLQFQGQYSGLRKYKQSLADHIPFDSFALGEFLIELPNFSSQLRKSLHAQLNTAREYFENAVGIGKAECILYEFDFSVKDALQGLAEVNFYLGEYRQRVLEYKYAEYVRHDKIRKEKRAEEKKREREADALEGED